MEQVGMSKGLQYLQMIYDISSQFDHTIFCCLHYHHGYLLNVNFDNNGREYNCGLKPVNMFIYIYKVVDTWIISREN